MRRTLLAALLMLVVPLAGCAQDGGTAGDGETATHDVAAVDNAFDPDTLTVAAGNEVEWTNQGEIDHTVDVRPQGEEQTLHSEEIPPGQRTSYLFEEAGTYEVWCRYHGQPQEGMAMTVTVE